MKKRSYIAIAAVIAAITLGIGLTLAVHESSRWGNIERYVRDRIQLR
jgi:hypothetical protein